MQKKKENLIEKIVKKDYNEELEKVLEIKSFSEDVQSILLSILYKVEAGYNDMEIVKRDIETKEEYIEKYIANIYDNIVNIKLINMNDKESHILEGGTFYINKEKKEIEVYPIERKVLYAINKISRKENIIDKNYYFINEVLSDLLNVGNIIQKVEPLRDFNGYSWTTVEREIESINHNLIYQMLRILVGNRFLEDWVEQKEKMIDYYEEFIYILEEKYGKELSYKIVNELIKISILFERIYNKEKLLKYEKEYTLLKKQVDEMKNMAAYVGNISKKKIKIADEIMKIDEIVNNKDEIKKEYIKRNKKLPLDKKIFSMRVLKNILLEEKKELFLELDKLNNLSNPKKFVEYKEEITNKVKLLSYLDIENMGKELEKSIEEIQKYFLQCFMKKIERVKTKQEIINLIYEFRYYMLIPKKNNIEFEEVIKEIIDKAIDLKAIIKISENKEIEYNIIKNIFEVRVIKIENIEMKITKEKEKYYLQIFDEKMFEEKIEILEKNKIKKEDLLIKANKKIKIFE